MENAKRESGESFGVLVVAHGDLASVLARLVEKILGSPLDIETVSVGWDDDV